MQTPSKQVRYKPKTGRAPETAGRPQAFGAHVERVTMSIYTSIEQYDAVVRRTMLRGAAMRTQGGRKRPIGISEIVREAVDLYLRTVPEENEGHNGRKHI